MKYANIISEALRARVEGVLADDRPKYLQDEIAIVEVMLQEAVARFSHYMSLPSGTQKEKALRDGGMQLTTSYYLAILKDYKSILIDQQKLQSDLGAILDNGSQVIAQTALHVEKVLVSYGQELGVDSRLAANEIAQAIGNNMMIPQGTDITPDQDVIEMDATIPYPDSFSSNGISSNGTA